MRRRAEGFSDKTVAISNLAEVVLSDRNRRSDSLPLSVTPASNMLVPKQ